MEIEKENQKIINTLNLLFPKDILKKNEIKI